MLKLILCLFVLSSPLYAQAKDKPLFYLKKVLADATQVGSGGDNYRCSVTTKWLPNGELEVTAISQYKEHKPSSSRVVFSKEKGANVEIISSEGKTEYKVSQSKILRKEGDYQVDLYEGFSLSFERSRLVSLSLTIAEVDHENDPIENVVRCSKFE